MLSKIRSLSLFFAIGVLGALLVAPQVFAKPPITVKGSGRLTFINANFTYDGAADAFQFTGSGKDNVGGTFTSFVVAENAPTSTACTAPDGSAGVVYTLVQASGVLTYGTGQVYSAALPSALNITCASSTTGSLGGSTIFGVIGGSGKFAGASGTLAVMLTQQALAAPGTPPGTNGIFGAGQFTTTGSVTP